VIQRYILNDEHEPVVETDLIKWAEWFEDVENRRVAWDVTTNNPDGNDDYVSTVFLGLDHNFFGGPPILFETLVSATDEITRHYTWWEAIAFHDQAVMAQRASV